MSELIHKDCGGEVEVSMGGCGDDECCGSYIEAYCPKCKNNIYGLG
jgi:hypothetical protein